MTKKHFNTMAASFRDILASCETEAERAKVARCIVAFCALAASTNSNFDRTRFMTACHD